MPTEVSSTQNWACLQVLTSRLQHRKHFLSKIFFCKHNLMFFSTQKLESTGKSADRFMNKPKPFLVY